MSYKKRVWNNNEIVRSEDLNRMEERLEIASTRNEVKQQLTTTETNMKKYVEVGWKQKHQLTQDDGRPIEVSKGNFNDIQNTGIYMGHSMNNAPLLNSANWWFIEVMRHTTGWVHQRATWFNTTTVETYERVLNNNNWHSWFKTRTQYGWGNWRTNGGNDLLVNDKRVMIGTTDGQLNINYGNDFNKGVKVHSTLETTGHLKSDHGLTCENGYFEVGTYNATTYGTGRMQSFYDGNNKVWKIQGKDGSGNGVPIGVQVNGKMLVTTDQVQLGKITSDTGNVTLSVSDDSLNILDEIVKKGAGLHTIYCKSGVKGQTPANISWRGFAHLDNPKFGYVVAKDYRNNMFTNYLDTGNWQGWVKHVTEEDLKNGDAKQVTKSGDTMTGTLKFKDNMLFSNTPAIDLSNSDIVGVNAIAFNDVSDNASEGVLFAKTGAKVGSTNIADYDSLRVIDGRPLINNTQLATINDVTTGDKHQVTKSGDTMTGMLTVKVPAEGTPIIAENAEGRMRLIPTKEYNWLQSGTNTNSAKDMVISGYNASVMEQTAIYTNKLMVRGDIYSKDKKVALMDNAITTTKLGGFNRWVNHEKDVQPIQVTRTVDGLVSFCGVLMLGITAPSTIMTKLPAEYRPKHIVWVNVVSKDHSGIYYAGDIEVHPNGDVRCGNNIHNAWVMINCTYPTF